MKKITILFTISFCLLIMQSCQKEGMDTNIKIDGITEIDTRSENSSEGSAAAEGCIPIYAYIDEITVTEEQFTYIFQQLVFPGISVINCDQVFASYNINYGGFFYYWQDLNDNLIILENNQPNHITFRIDPYRVHCYNKCEYNPFCDENGLRIVKGTGANNCTLTTLDLLEYPNILYVELNISSYLDNSNCNVAICDDDTGGG